MILKQASRNSVFYCHYPYQRSVAFETVEHVVERFAGHCVDFIVGEICPRCRVMVAAAYSLYRYFSFHHFLFNKKSRRFFGGIHI